VGTTALIEIEHLSGHVDYQEGWDLQRRTHAAVGAGERGHVAFLLEHAGVYTAGRRTRADEYPADGTPVIDVDRGGKITWHGPGQLVAYPIVALAEPVDVVRYVRTLEDAVIDVCTRLGLAPVRVDGRSGVWFAADDGTAPGGGPARRARKVCAIGARVAAGVTMHGLALNCDPDLGAFGVIVPCGIDDADVTSLSAELGRDVTVDEIRPLLADALQRHLAPLVTERTARRSGPVPAPAPAVVG